MPKEDIDALDIELLKQMLENSRQTSSQLGLKLNAHKDTIRKRISNLISKGVIERFTIAINQAKLSALYPSIWRVIFSISVLRERDALVEELLENNNVIEIDEASPAAVHDLIVHAQFRDMKEFDSFSNYLKSKSNIDPTKLNVTPIYRQHRQRKRIISVVANNNSFKQ